MTLLDIAVWETGMSVESAISSAASQVRHLDDLTLHCHPGKWKYLTPRVQMDLHKVS